MVTKRQLAPINRSGFYRIYSIDRLIRQESYPNVPKLAEHLEVGRRTIERDIEFMRDLLGAPIKYSHRERGYYYAKGNFTLPDIKLTKNELAALYLSKRVLSKYTGTAYESYIISAFYKICHCLPEDLSPDLNALEEDITFAINPLRGEGEDFSANYCQVLDAIQDQTVLSINYYSASRNQDSRRDIAPYHLHYFQGAWYVIAYCCWRKEVRTFALDRIRTIASSNEKFTPAENFSLDNYLGDSLGIERGQQTQKIRISFDPHQARWVRERKWHPSQEIENQADGSLIITFRVSSWREVKQWVLSYGHHAQVLEPKSLREEVAREIAQMKKVYLG